MKATSKLMGLSLLIGGLLTTSGVWAVDLPDMGETSKAQPKTNAIAAESIRKDAQCTKCHDESETRPVLAIYQTKHGVKGDPRTPTCQSCHGESTDHINNTGGKETRNKPDVVFGTKGIKRGSSGAYPPSDREVQVATCLSCHEKDLHRTRWTGGAHDSGDVSCASCHEMHTAHDNVRDKKTQPQVCFTCHKEQRTDSHKISHHPIGENKVVCADCHNPHGSAGPHLLKKNTVTETCYTCHAEKRGPLLWEHEPVTEDCTNCHTPHGSNITPLLKSRTPFLCSECHDGPHHSDDPAGKNVAGWQGGLTGDASENYTGRACLNCHSMVHGSNNPAGALLHR